MKEYRVSLEVTTSPAINGRDLAALLRVPRAALVEEPVRRSVIWRYEPSTGQSGRLGDRIRQLAAEVRPRRDLSRGEGIRRVVLGIDVKYDTASCTVSVPMSRVLWGPRSLLRQIPRLSTVELRCSFSENELAADSESPPERGSDSAWEQIQLRFEEWKAEGRPHAPRAPSPLMIDPSRTLACLTRRNRRLKDANRYGVALNAITTNSAAASEVADVLGLPQEAFTGVRLRDGKRSRWSCRLEAAEKLGLSEQIRLLNAEVRPRRRFQFGGEIQEIYLDLAVFFDVRASETCSVSLPVSRIRPLARKIFMADVQVACYPCANEE